MSYADIPSICKTLMLAYIFALFCIIILSFPLILSGRRHGKKIISLFCVLISGTMLLVYAADIKTFKQGLSVNPFVSRFCALPVALPLFLLAIITGFVGYTVIKERNKRHSIITRLSVKEGIDKLNSGLCFAYESGRVILKNYIMTELSYTILGKDLQNAQLFWESLSTGNVKKDIVCLSLGENPSFRLPDGKVWTFARTVIDGIVQFSSADTTYLQNLTEELMEKNKELEAIHSRLIEYGEKVDELTRAKERLETKIDLHRRLGHALLVARHYIVGNNVQREAPFDIWEKCIAMLGIEIEQTSEEPFEMFMKAAKNAGVEVVTTGEPPKPEEINNLVALAAAESLVNAVRHANATALYIDFDSSGNMYSARFTNNGIRPYGEIAEGGGLGALRKKTEIFGGVMTVQSSPEFALIVLLPKKGEHNEKDNDC